MPDGFRAARAFVEVYAKLDDRAVLRAAEDAVRDMDSTMTRGAERTGERITDTFADAGSEAGKAIAERASTRLRDESGRFVSSGKKVGSDSSGGFLSGFGDKIGSGFSSMVQPIMVKGSTGAAGVMAAAMAPIILSGVAGAVVGGAGIGGVVGGMIIASRHPAVKAAGKDLGTFVIGDLEDRAEDFVPAMLASIGKVRRAWSDMGPDLDRIFEADRFVDPLVDGILSGTKKVVAGVADMVENADPAIQAFSRQFDAIGDATGEFFSGLAEHADEGAMAIDELTLATTRFIEVTGKVIDAGAAVKQYGGEIDVAIDRGRYWLEENTHLAEGLAVFGVQLDLTADGFAAGSREAEAYKAATLGVATVADFATLKQAGMTDAWIAGKDASGTYRSKIDEVNGALGRTGPAAQSAIPGVRTLEELMDDWADKTIDAERANMRLEAAIDDATASAKRNGKGIDDNIPKQRANREALFNIAAAAREASAKILHQTGSQEQASAAMQRGRTAFLAAAAAMNVGSAQANRLADQLFGIPKDTKPKVTVADAQAKAAIAAIKGGIATIHGKTVTVTVKYETRGSVQGEHIIGQGTLTKAEGGWITGGSGSRDDVPVLAMGGEFMLRKRAAAVLERQFGRGFLDRLNNWDRGGLPRRQTVRAASVDAPAAAPAPVPVAAPAPAAPSVVQHFGPGSIVLDASKIGSVADLIRMLENLVPAARAMGAAV